MTIEYDSFKSLPYDEQQLWVHYAEKKYKHDLKSRGVKI